MAGPDSRAKASTGLLGVLAGRRPEAPARARTAEPAPAAHAQHQDAVARQPAPASHAHHGVVARLSDLIATRPRGGGSFASANRVSTQLYGGHRSAFRGRGMEFDEVRAYHPGDDVRTIDWRVTARTGRTHTKLFQEERERPVLLLVDARAAMRFGTRESFKSVLAAKAAAVLSWVGIAGGDRVGGVVLSPSGLAAFRPERSRRRILAFIGAIADATAERTGPPAAEPSLADALARLRTLMRPGTLVFLISDFGDLDAHAAREAGRLAMDGPVTCVFTFDRLEAQMPGPGVFPVTDGAAVARLDADRAALRSAYARRFAERRGALEHLARERGMVLVDLETGTDPADALNPERLRRAGPPARRTVA
ncbi:DUF58 domain-containing protein [Xanthobacter sp. KR7-65]|uniref:DUF58 domain-containing protein n=1 Tax=Xanthobacter sp. KR7-65 TaxID=3156612 RepID=UPI0032B5E829